MFLYYTTHAHLPTHIGAMFSNLMCQFVSSGLVVNTIRGHVFLDGKRLDRGASKARVFVSFVLGALCRRLCRCALQLEACTQSLVIRVDAIQVELCHLDVTLQRSVGVRCLPIRLPTRLLVGLIINPVCVGCYMLFIKCVRQS